MANINLHDKNEVAAFAEALVNELGTKLKDAAILLGGLDADDMDDMLSDALEESPDEIQQLRAELVTTITNKLIATE